jgi:hypothetical protein
MPSSDERVKAAVDAALQRHLLGTTTTERPPEHVSHARFSLPRGADGTPACVIEPAVPCTHCGYCLSLGH